MHGPCSPSATAARAPHVAGMSWDAERRVWERQNQSRFGAFGSGRNSSSSPWDLRAAAFRSPASLSRFRQQAERVFEDTISSSVFVSPAMQRFRRQTDEMFQSIAANPIVSALNTGFTDIRSTLTSWFW